MDTKGALTPTRENALSARGDPARGLRSGSVCRKWSSSTGLTAVSKFKPHLHVPAQWAVGTHRKGTSRMKKSNFQNELTNQKFDSSSD